MTKNKYICNPKPQDHTCYCTDVPLAKIFPMTCHTLFLKASKKTIHSIPA